MHAATPQITTRSPRFDLNLPVRFFSNDGLFTGHCVNMSATGMLAALDQTPDVWLKGDLTITLGDESIVIQARIARVDGKDAGFAFQGDSEHRAKLIQPLLDYALDHQQLAERRSQ